MKQLEFKIIIDAPREIVWNILIGNETYPVWTYVFGEGSKVETDWKAGSQALFLNGDGSGMVSVIEENTPYSFLSIKHIGWVKDGVEDTESEEIKSWAGSHENYTLKDLHNNTLWIVEIEVTPEFESCMLEMWPKAQQKVKEMAEATNQA